MEEKPSNTSGDTGTGGAFGDSSGSLNFPSAAERDEAAVTEAKHKLDTQPTEQVLWPSAQELHQWVDGLGGSFRCPAHPEPLNWPMHQELYRAEEDFAS